MARKVLAFFLFVFPFIHSKQVFAWQVEWYREGQRILDQTGDMAQARDFFIKAANADTLDIQANQMAGIACLESSNRYMAITYLNRVFRQDSTFRQDIRYLIGLSLQSGYQFQQASENYQIYEDILKSGGETKEFPLLDDVLKRIKECEWGRYYIQHPKSVEITNLGDPINSAYPDYAPLIDSAESVLIFTSRRGKNNQSPEMEGGAYYEDIFVSIWENGGWGNPVNAGRPINTAYHDSDIALSRSGNRLFIYKDSNDGDIYFSDLKAAGWTEPAPLSVLNSAYTERSVSISSDGNMMIFSSNRPGGFGGFDLYRITNDGRYWSKPENLGPQINTRYDEDSPFIDYSDSILFFSSKGWNSMGGYDIFKTNLNKLEMPQNLGYPVNTPEDDIYFITTKEENRAYFASLRSEGFGDLDIYMLKNLAEPFNVIRPADSIPKPGLKNDKARSEVQLQPVYFEFGSTVLIPGSDSVMTQNAMYLLQHPDIGITLSGHTDNVGSDEENVVLSMERAMKVAILLKQQGIPETRIRLEAKGECCPVVSNANEQERSKNRRVEFLIINQ